MVDTAWMEECVMYEGYSVRETIEKLESSRERGLSEKESAKRLGAYGRNELQENHKKTRLEGFIEQLCDPLIYVLIAAAVVSVCLKETSDAIIIGIVVLVNAFVGMAQEGKARKALEALKKLSSPQAVVLREGKRRELPATLLVPGDIVLLEAGCQVPADMRLLETNQLMAEESALTGETLPVEKDASFQAAEGEELPLGDRKNMAYMSTVVTGGRGSGVVIATGSHTELGRIAALIAESKEELTPLQKRLGELGKVLSALSLLLCAALFLLAILQKRNIMEMLLTAISLAVAAVPEGLPAVVTICLALSVTRMVRVNTIVRRLPSVETLGAVSVVCSDKTGTLTQNRMMVEQCYLNGKTVTLERLPDREKERLAAEQVDFFRGMTLCNDAVVEQSGNRMGDPTELALLDMAEQFGIHKSMLEAEYPRQAEISFDSDRKMMSTFHSKGHAGVGRQTGAGRHAGDGISYTKGAPDEIIKHCTHILLSGSARPLTEQHRRQIQQAAAEMSSQALRTLAVAMRKGVTGPAEEQLVFVGITGMKDPARPEAAEAVSTFREAGVDTVMITGDHVETAFAVGRQLGIVNRMEQCMTGEELQSLSDEELERKLTDTRAFARVSPAQKVRIVKGFQSLGKLVAMTGDGVNDAPSLKMADIGIAMGQNGTDVAKQAADMVLVDDNFATIEKAMEEGRGVYENIRKSVIFLLSSNLGEIMTMFFAVLCGLAAPLKSSHILWINLITDSLPALALGMDKNDGKSLMKHSPRKPSESLFARGGLLCTCFYGVLIACISLTAFLLLPITIIHTQGLEITIPRLTFCLANETILAKCQTYAFTVLGMSQLYHAVGMRDVDCSFFRMKHLDNKLMIGACILGFLLQFAVTEVPFLIHAFGTSHLSVQEWLHLSLLSSFPLLAHECIALFGRKHGDRTSKAADSVQAYGGSKREYPQNV